MMSRRRPLPRRHRVPTQALASLASGPYAAVQQLGRASRRWRLLVSCIGTCMSSLAAVGVAWGLAQRPPEAPPPPPRQTPTVRLQRVEAPQVAASAARAAAATAVAAPATPPPSPAPARPRRPRPQPPAPGPRAVTTARGQADAPTAAAVGPEAAEPRDAEPELLDLTHLSLPGPGAAAATSESSPDAAGRPTGGPDAGGTGATAGVGAQPLRRQWACAWPPESAAAGHREVRLQVQVHLDALGTPQQVDVLTSAPTAFVAAAQGCALREAYRVARDADGQPKAAVTAPFNVRFLR